MKLQYFTAPWCQPCKTFGPMLEKLTERWGLVLEKVNIQEEPERLPTDVLGIPTVILQTLEGEEINRFTGAKSEVDLADWLVMAGV